MDSMREIKKDIPLIKHLPGPRKIRRMVVEWCKERHKERRMYHRPRQYADYLYKLSFGRGIDWKHPRDLNEWINYLAFKTDTTEWSRLADKYEVRNFVADRGLSHILLTLYGKWEKPSDIDFDGLPNSFAIKTNCSCGDTVIVKDKLEADFDSIRQKMQVALDTRDDLFTQSAEPHYLRIRQLIVCEQLIDSSCLVDYKIWCFNGEPFGILTCSNRDMNTHHSDLAMFDLEWNRHDEWMTDRYRNDVEVAKPVHLEEMLEYARILSKGFPEVRVDFYDTPESVYFGEMTFTSCCGRMAYFAPELLKMMGAKVHEAFVNE